MLKTSLMVWVEFNLSSRNAFILGQVKILSSGKEQSVHKQACRGPPNINTKSAKPIQLLRKEINLYGKGPTCTDFSYVVISKCKLQTEIAKKNKKTAAEKNVIK